MSADSTSSTLTCQFQNNQNTNKKTCSVKYSVCDEEQIFTVEGNTTLESPNKVTLEINLPNGSDCYTYTITAFDGSNTVMVEGKVKPSGKQRLYCNLLHDIVTIILILQMKWVVHQ